MSFGLRISFGRLCKKRRNLDEVYSWARKIEGWETHKDGYYKCDINKKLGLVYWQPVKLNCINITAD